MNMVKKRANKVLCILLALTVLSGPLGILASAADLSLGNGGYVNFGRGAVKGSNEPLNVVNNPNANYYYYTKANGAMHQLRMMYVASDGSGTPIYDNNGNVIWGYCIEYGASGSSWIETQATDITRVSEWINDLNQEQRAGITYTTLYGFPSNNFGVSYCDAYAATQAIIWEFQQGCRTLSGGLNNAKFYNDFIKSTPAEAAYNALVNEIYNAVKMPSFNGATADLAYNSMTGKYQTSLFDTNGVLQNYTLSVNNSNIQTSISGNTLTLSSNSVITSSVKITFTKKIPSGTSQAMMVMYDENNQAAIIGQSKDPVYANINVRTYTGDMKIIKTSEDSNVSGITFTISGCGNVYTRTTDSNGVINLSGLPTGTYNVTEESINKYVPQTTQTVTISANTTSIVRFSNVLKKFNVTLTKTDTETGQTAQGDATLKGAVYGIYNKGVLVDTYTTNSKGEFTTNYYICGDYWTIKEITPSNGYQLDSKEYSIGASALNYVIENNSINLSVTEDCIKGKIAITKHSDDGSTKIETPEVGAQFEIYLKSSGSYSNAKAIERDVITCDENGYAITKDLPYGTYTVHQIKGAAGREYISDFDVCVIKNNYDYSYIINNSYFQGYVKVIKKDSGTGKNIAYAGAGFQIYKPDGSLVKMTVTYPTVKELDTFYTDDNGELVTPQKLGIGAGYKLVEIQAPYGYVLDKTPVYFNISQEDSIKEDGISVIKVVKSDTAQKGVITIEKKGKVFDTVIKSDNTYTPGYKVKGLKGAVFEIIAKDDIYTLDGTLRAKKGEVVDTVTTGEDGTAKSKALYLGDYEIKEIKGIYNRLVESMEQRKIIQNATRRNKLMSGGNDVQETIQAQGNLQDVIELLSNMRKNKELLLHCSVFIELKANDLEELRELQSEILMELTRAKISVDRLTLRQKEGFLSALPTGYNRFGAQYERVLPTSSVANLYPFNYSGKTDPKGFYIGKDKFGTNILVDFDKRSDDKTNSNCLILGNSGQGKSFLMKLILTNLRESDKSVITLDAESEYEDLTNNLGGCYIDFMSGEYIINPLEPKAWSDAQTISEQSESDAPDAFRKVTRLSQHIAYLKDFFRAYKDFNDSQIDTIEILLSKLYARFGINDSTDYSILIPEDYPIMSDLYDLVEEEFMTYDNKRKYLYTEEILQDICLGLNSMCKGAESKYFNGHTNIIDDTFLCFGVKGLMDTNKRLKDAMLFNILSYMSNSLLGKGDTVASIDELYLFLTNLTAIEYIRNASKRVRKKDSAIILASQNIEDFLLEGIREYTKPLFSIPTHQFLFNAGQIDPRLYIDTLQLEQSEFELIKYPQRGVCLYRCGNERYLLQVIAPEYKAKIFGSTGGR